MSGSTALTGIPIEILFSIIGALGLIVYGDLRWNMRKLMQESQRRSKQLSVFRIYLSQLCSKAGIHFDDKDNGE